MIRLIRAPFVMALASLALTGMFAASAKAVTLSNLAVRSLEPIAANDNHQPGGTLAQGRLHLALVARRGRWYPDGPRTLGLPIDAFGEVGRQLSIPGPLLRAPLGTRVEATVRNDLSHDLTIHGLGAPTIMTTSATGAQIASVDAASALTHPPRPRKKHRR